MGTSKTPPRSHFHTLTDSTFGRVTGEGGAVVMAREEIVVKLMKSLMLLTNYIFLSVLHI